MPCHVSTHEHDNDNSTTHMHNAYINTGYIQYVHKFKQSMALVDGLHKENEAKLSGFSQTIV